MNYLVSISSALLAIIIAWFVSDVIVQDIENSKISKQLFLTIRFLILFLIGPITYFAFNYLIKFIIN
jgi:hypothetical protein